MPGYDMPFCPTFPGFLDQQAAIVDGNKPSWRRLPPPAKAMIARSIPSFTRGIVEIVKIA
jgi:hypothetical protein